MTHTYMTKSKIRPANDTENFAHQTTQAAISGDQTSQHPRLYPALQHAQNGSQTNVQNTAGWHAHKHHGPVQIYESKEPAQPYAPLSVTMILQRDNEKYHGVTIEGNEIKQLDGRYLFVNRTGLINTKKMDTKENESDFIRMIKEPEDIALVANGTRGHTSMTRTGFGYNHRVIPIDTVYYAGVATFTDGRLESWSNESGHYRPVAPHGIPMPQAIKRYFPLDKYKSSH